MMIEGKPVWAYEDATGTPRRGLMTGFNDFGGTDISYRFHRLGDDDKPIRFEEGGIMLDVVSGERLKRAQRVWDAVAS